MANELKLAITKVGVLLLSNKKRRSAWM